MAQQEQRGELLAALARATPQTANPAGRNQYEVTSNTATRPPSPYAQALADTGTTRQQAHRYHAPMTTDTLDAWRYADPAKLATTDVAHELLQATLRRGTASETGAQNGAQNSITDAMA
ncbi:MAG TPA: hypothetical protein PKJ45_08055 [Rubrivivax sp.]|nr:hypothetical protein [Rubrivivax sp.]